MDDGFVVFVLIVGILIGAVLCLIITLSEVADYFEKDCATIGEIFNVQYRRDGRKCELSDDGIAWIDVFDYLRLVSEEE